MQCDTRRRCKASSNTGLFDFSLAYNQPGAGVTRQYNGNIARMDYTAAAPATKPSVTPTTSSTG